MGYNSMVLVLCYILTPEVDPLRYPKISWKFGGQYRCTDGASGTSLINSCLNLLRTQEHTLFKFKKE